MQAYSIKDDNIPCPSHAINVSACMNIKGIKGVHPNVHMNIREFPQTCIDTCLLAYVHKRHTHKEIEKDRDREHTLCGLIPAAATYISSFPIGIPIPWTPRSPKPRIRLPSVRTIMSTYNIEGNMNMTSTLRNLTISWDQKGFPQALNWLF